MQAYKHQHDDLIQTKIFRPPVGPDLVPRPQLLARLDKALESKLTLISAPAGFGKSTLASAWLSHLDQDWGKGPYLTGWLSLDESDNEPVRYFTYLAATLKPMSDRWPERFSLLLQAPQLPPAESMAGLVVNEMAAGHRPLILILDDYHRISNRYLHDWLSFLLERQPQHLHLVILTREDPPIPLARLRGRGELTDIRQQDLRFNAQETATFLSNRLRITLSDQEIKALEARTEGWIAGLQLAVLSMRGQEDIHQYIQTFTGSNRYILDYLVEEVFDKQPDDIQYFLLRTSILNRLSGPLCDAVLGKSAEVKAEGHRPSQEILDFLERANLFVVPLDESRQWYRYHHLFGDLLQYKLRLSKIDGTELHRRARRWHEEHGLTTEAIGHGLKAQDWPQVASLIEGNSEQLLKEGQISTLLGWIENLPPEIVETRPELALNAAWAYALAGRLAESEKYLESVEPLTKTFPEMKAGEITLRAHIARTRHDLPQTIALSKQALTMVPEDDHNSRSILGVNLGATYLYTGQLERAHDTWHEAAIHARHADNLHAAALALTFVGQIKAAWGQLHQAADLHRQAIRLGVEKQVLPVSARAHVNLALIQYEWDNLNSAGQNLKQALQLSRLIGDRHVQRDANRVLAMVRQAAGDLVGADNALNEADKFIDKEVPINGVLATALTHLRIALMRRDLVEASRWDVRIDEVAPETTPVRMDLLANAGCLDQIGPLRARLMLAKGNSDGLHALLADSYRETSKNKLIFNQIGIRLLQARIAADPDQALAYLSEALSTAELQECHRTILEEGESIRELLHLALRYERSAGYVTKLLASLHSEVGSESIPYTKQILPAGSVELPSRSPLLEPLSGRELEILDLVAGQKTNAEIAQVLFLSPNTIKTHLRHIYEKLGVHDRRSAVARARDLNLL